MKKLPVFACLLFLICSVTGLVAQDVPTITIRKGESINVALGSLPADIGPVLKNDLDLSGWFNLVAPGQGSYEVSGTSGAGGFQGVVKDRAGGVVLSKTYRGPARQAAHEFADDIVETLTGNPGIANTRIAFVSTRTGRKEIYIADYDGANVQQITRDNSLSVSPSLSPDGRRLAYTGYQSGYADIYVINLASGARSRIVKFPGTNSGAAFSPDGGRIACTVSKDGNPELYVIGVNGSGARRLTSTRGVESSPTWSPDGSEIAYSADAGGSPRLYRISSSGGTPRVISTGYSYNTEPNWSPDGKKIAFNIRSGGFAVAVYDIPTGNTRVVSGSGAEDPVWGPDSRHLIYSNGSSLILLDVVTGRTTSIISGLGKVSEPSWSRKN